MKLYLILFLFFPLCIKAQNIEALKIYDHKKQDGNSLKIYSENGIIRLEALKANIIEVSYSKSDYDLIAKENEKSAPQVYLRVTQNLDDVFMFTDSLIIVINKIDFSIKFRNLKGESYLTQTGLSLKGDTNIVDFETGNTQSFYLKNRKLSENTPHLYGPKLIKTDKNYALYFCGDKKWSLALDAKKLHFIKNANKDFRYYFIMGNNSNIKAIIK